MSRVSPEAAIPIDLARDAAPSAAADLFVLTKARLTMLVLITTLVGFCMGSRGEFDWFMLLRVLFGTTFVTASAAVLNQFMERRVDRLMDRTKDRPLPAGRMRPMTAFGLGILLASAGVVYLALRVNALSATLAALTLAIYLLFYTPLKRHTFLCVAIGAVSGAIPPVIGWTGAHPSLDAGAWILFGILFCWQMPHFLAIAWLYRTEYSQAGFVMLRRRDDTGRITALESLLFTVVLAIISMLPFFLGMANGIYLAGSALCNAALLAFAFRFLLDRNRPSARRLFLASILYLPVLLGLLVFTRA